MDYTTVHFFYSKYFNLNKIQNYWINVLTIYNYYNGDFNFVFFWFVLYLYVLNNQLIINNTSSLFEMEPIDLSFVNTVLIL